MGDLTAILGIATSLVGVLFSIISLRRLSRNKDHYLHLKDVNDEIKTSIASSSSHFARVLLITMKEVLYVSPLLINEIVNAMVMIFKTLLGYTKVLKKNKEFKAIHISNKPPKIGLLLVRFLINPRDQEVLLGDMSEIFRKMIDEQGLLTAKIWYIWQATRSAISYIIQKLLKWGIFAYLVDIIRKIV